MKYIRIYENFNNYDINYWMSELDEPELYNKKNVKELISRVENFVYPFDVYLLDNDLTSNDLTSNDLTSNDLTNIWTSNILNENITENIVKKITITNQEDINIEQTIRGRLLELDFEDYIKSSYVSINKDLPITNLSINIKEDLNNILYELNDLNINTNYTFMTSPWSTGIDYYNIISISIHRPKPFNFLPIGETISALSRIESYINRVGFSSIRPTPLQGNILNNISINGYMIDEKLSLTELIKKSNNFSIQFPFNQLMVNYYKTVN